MEARLLLLEKEERLLRPLRLLSLLLRILMRFSSLEGRSTQEIGGSVTRQLQIVSFSTDVSDTAGQAG